MPLDPRAKALATFRHLWAVSGSPSKTLVKNISAWTSLAFPVRRRLYLPTSVDRNEITCVVWYGEKEPDVKAGRRWLQTMSRYAVPDGYVLRLALCSKGRQRQEFVVQLQKPDPGAWAETRKLLEKDLEEN